MSHDQTKCSHTLLQFAYQSVGITCGLINGQCCQIARKCVFITLPYRYKNVDIGNKKKSKVAMKK